MTETYLDSLWSKAVRVLKGERCAKCGNPAGGIHHIIRRGAHVLRWDVRNGVPLCPVCHPIADRSQSFALSLVSAADRRYIEQMSVYTLKDWLKLNGLSRAEFQKQRADALKKIIKGEI